MQLRTECTELMGLRVPVVSAPMSGIAGGALALAVTNGGGFGMIGHCEGQELKDEIAIARKAQGLPEGGGGLPLQTGIGILAFCTNAPYMDDTSRTVFLKQVVEARPSLIWLAFEGVKGTHRRLIESIRALGFEGPRCWIAVMVGTLELAKEVCEYGIDIIVAQGTEAGGHANDDKTGLPLFSLLPLVHSHLQTLESPPLLLAAGGLSTGEHLVSVLPYASGIVVGTAFTACPESKYGQRQKEKIVAAKGGEATVKTAMFDRIRGHPFGEGIDGRALRNDTTTEEDEGVDEAELRKRFNKAVENGDPGLMRSAVWSGTGVGLLNQVRPAREVVERIEREALDAIARVAACRSR